MRPHLTMEQRQLARRLSAKGLSLREIGRQVGCSHEVVRSVVRGESKRPVRSGPWRPVPGGWPWRIGVEPAVLGINRSWTLSCSLCLAGRAT